MDRILVPLYKHVLDTYQSGDYSSSRPTTAVGLVVVERDLFILQTNGSNGFISASIWSAGSGFRSRFKLIRISRVGLQG